MGSGSWALCNGFSASPTLQTGSRASRGSNTALFIGDARALTLHVSIRVSSWSFPCCAHCELSFEASAARFDFAWAVRLGAQFAVSGILISSLSTASHLQCCDGQFVWHVGLKFSCAVANLGSASWPSSGTNVTCKVEAPPGRLS